MSDEPTDKERLLLNNLHALTPGGYRRIGHAVYLMQENEGDAFWDVAMALKDIAEERENAQNPQDSEQERAA